VIKGGKTILPPKVGSRLEVKLVHEDSKFYWYTGVVAKTREETIDKTLIRVYKVIGY
jgi:hypothetical protein